MFPEISKNKKKVKIGTPEMISQCEQALKQIQYKSKKAIKNISNQLVSDFNKVCRLKDINQFYSQYFFYFVQRQLKQSMQKIFTQEVQNIMLNRSYYQKITVLIKERSSLIWQTKQQMNIIEGFTLMNAGKIVPHTLKILINELIKQCSSLDAVKNIQMAQVQKLTNCIQKLRNNLKEIIQLYISWEFQLKSFNSISQISSFKKTKVIFPQNDINCIFIGLFDTNFIKSSFLNMQIKFLNVQYDPFFLYLQPLKKTNKILQQYFLKKLKQQNQVYKKTENFLNHLNPKKVKEIIIQKEKQIDFRKTSKSKKKLISTSRQKKRSQNKLKEEISNSKIFNQTGGINSHKKIQNLKKIITIDNDIIKIYNSKKVKQSRQKKLQKSKSKSIERSKSNESLQKSFEKARSVLFIQQRDVSVPSSQSKTSRNNNNYDLIDRPRSMSNINILKISKNNDFDPNFYKNDNNNNIQTKEQLRNSLISKVYKKNKQSNYNNDSRIKLHKKQQFEYNLLSNRFIETVNKNKLLQNKIKELNRQKQKLQKSIEKQGSKANKQKQLYARQLQKYQQAIKSLKNQAQQNLKSMKGISNVSNVYLQKNNKYESPRKSSLPEKPEQNLLISRLHETINMNKNLQNTIKQLNKQKLKLQKQIQKQGSKANKQKQLYERKLQKYQQTIDLIKNEPNNRLIQKKYGSIYRKSNKQISKMNEQIKQINKQDILFQKDNKTQRSQLLITNNKKKIQIVYLPKKKRSQYKKEQDNNQNNKSLVKQKQKQYQNQKTRLQRQKILLQKRLQNKLSSQSVHESVLLKKLQQKQNQLQKYKQRIQRQKQQKHKYQEKIKQLRKKINQQYEHKLQRQRRKFNQEKQYLFIKIKQQKQSKLQKQKYLSKQMIYLKQMQLRQNQLLNLLQNQRKQKQHKQLQFKQQIQKKQQQLQLYEIQQIKRTIQRQVKQQMNILSDQQEQNQLSIFKKNKQFQQKKLQLQKQIKQMIQGADYQLHQLDQQNHKLKQLIQKIKEEQIKVINNLKADVQIQSNQYEYEQIDNINFDNQQNQIQMNQENNNQHLKSSKLSIIKQNNNLLHNNIQNNQSLVQQLKYKAQLQLSRQQLINSRYKQMQQSPVYKQRQKIQNIIQHYLKNPHQYPQNRSIIMKQKQRNNLVQQIVNKSKKAKQFQQQLMQLKNVQKFVPAQKDDDPIKTHILNLREQYQNEQAQSLRRQLFPAQYTNYQNIHELSFQSQQPPPITLKDHIDIHQKQYLQKRQQIIGKKKKNNQKNFMAINRMKLLQKEQQKRQKQRKLIQEQTKKKIKKIKFKQKKKQQKDYVQFQSIKKQIKQKQKKRQIQLQKAKKGQTKLNHQKQQSLFKNNTLSKNKQLQQKNIDLQENNDQNQFLLQQNNLINQQQIKLPQKDIKKIQQKDLKQLSQKDLQQIKQQKKQQNLQKEDEYDQQFQSDEQNEFMNVQQLKGISQIQKNSTQRQNFQQNQTQKQLQNLPSQNIALMQLQREKQQLKHDILSYQQQIRSFISSSFDYFVYQHYIEQDQLQTYLKQIIQLSSQQMVQLNNNKTLFKDIKDFQTLVVLIAKNQQTNLQIGIGIFHKEYQQGQYICDYLLAHNMKDMLDLVFNFSHYLYHKDIYPKSIQFIFSFSGLIDPVNKLHFVQFQDKCRRLGQVYLKLNQNQTRKYILKRNLFQKINQEHIPIQGKGIKFQNKLQIHENYMKQRNQGFKNLFKQNYTSNNILLSLYLKNYPNELQKFKKQAEDDLHNRETLLTAMAFLKKNFLIKNTQPKSMQGDKKILLYRDILYSIFQIDDLQQDVKQLKLSLSQIPPKKFKRCILDFDHQNSLNYCVLTLDQALNQVQASNSSQIGVFLPIIPKYKVLILSASEFLTACETNPDMNVFFYVKHYIKNISDVKKQTYSRVFIPQINLSHWTFYQTISKKLKRTVFGKQQIQIGFKSKINNSVVYTPHHTDLVIEKPFIISILSGNVEKVLEGSPIFCKLII